LARLAVDWLVEAPHWRAEDRARIEAPSAPP
jgi:hypothetical protein